MKKVEAVIRPNKLEPAKEALAEVGCQGLTVTEVKGFGRQKGHSEVYRGAEYVVEFQPKIKIEVVVPDRMVEDTIKALVAATATGQIGDGKVFILPVDDSVRIRTGESGEASLT